MPNARRLRFFLPAAAVLVLLLTILCITQQSVPAPLPKWQNSPQIGVLMPDGTVVQTELERFLTGVVAAEMPALFAEDALAAQAVAARTYIAGKMPPYGSGKHGEAAVCTDPACCQAWLSEEQLRENWGENAAAYLQKTEQAVLCTFGQVLCWQDAPAETPFCSTCGGATEAAEDVWGGARPYLQSVPCGYDGHSPRFAGYAAMSVAEGAALLGAAEEEVRQMRVTGYTTGGRVQALTVGSQTLPGTEVRSLLGLNSAAFSWLIVGDTLLFATLGYGHGVGLCQYGADGMAQQGCGWQEILQHYYSGTVLTQLPYAD